LFITTRGRVTSNISEASTKGIPLICLAASYPKADTILDRYDEAYFSSIPREVWRTVQ